MGCLPAQPCHGRAGPDRGAVEIEMMVRRLAYSLTCASAALVVTVVAAYAGPKAVLELFTSQGCSSCPPADQLLAQYSDDPDVVALSLAVNYWDYLGWK